MSEYVLQLLIAAIMVVEAPVNEKHAQAAIEREGSYGVMQIRQPCLSHVNEKRGTNLHLNDVRISPELSAWVFRQYVQINKCTTPEQAARTWNGGPRGPHKKATEAYWRKVSEEMARIQFQLAAQRVRKLYGKGL